MDILRFHVSHSPDTIRLIPGEDAHNRDVGSRICSAIQDTKSAYELIVAIRQADDMTTATIRFFLGVILEESREGPYALGETTVPLNRDVQIDDIVRAAVQMIEQFEEEDLGPRR